MPKAIITGATGFIGSHVVRHLLQQGWQIAIISRPESDYSNLGKAKSQIAIFEFNGNMDTLIEYVNTVAADVVMHIAASVITNYSPKQITTLIRSNIEFGSQVLEAMRYSDTRLFIGTGSYWQNFKSENYNPVDLYAATKEAFEIILQYYVDAFDFRALTLRLYDVYGEDDKRPKLWTLLRDLAGTEKSLDMTPGEQLVDMVHVSDVAKAYEAAYNYLSDNSNIRNAIFGVCSGKQLPLKEIVELFQDAIGKKINLNWGAREYKKREVMHPFMGYKTLPNWRPVIDLVNGLTKFNGG